MGLFRHSFSRNHTCPASPLSENATQPFVGNMSFHHFNMILSGSCTAVTCLVIFTLMFMHATHLSKANEQVKIMKIAFLIPLYSFFSFLSICFPKAFVYLVPWLSVFQSVALGSFFLLMCEWVSPSQTQRTVFFAALQVPDRTGVTGAGGLTWYRRKWIMIFQYPVISILASVATDVTQAASVYCLYSSKPYFAHLWISIVQNISIVLAVLAVFKFYMALKNHVAHHRPLAKLLAFKLIVLLTFLQGIIFWILRDANILKSTSKLTFADLNIGIPTLIISLEMVPFSIFFHYAYSVRQYIASGDTKSANESNLSNSYSIQGQNYQGGFLGGKAWLATFNPTETWRAVVFAFKMASELREESVADGYRAGGLHGPLQDKTGSLSIVAA